jgi:hypothetical protein
MNSEIIQIYIAYDSFNGISVFTNVAWLPGLAN